MASLQNGRRRTRNGEHQDFYVGIRRSLGFYLTPGGLRRHMQGQVPLLDLIVRYVLASRPDGGRFCITPAGVVLVGSMATIARFTPAAWPRPAHLTPRRRDGDRAGRSPASHVHVDHSRVVVAGAEEVAMAAVDRSEDSVLRRT